MSLSFKRVLLFCEVCEVEVCEDEGSFLLLFYGNYRKANLTKALCRAVTQA